ncbi:hypothetical protein [Brevibacillus sp. DP1.3A]|uniref:hypothetical protein n=1 Tax=Brevibacillus sp. DP1.3A TaxID=2738867 RepID=UPI001D16DCB5|nr:hypothetical protein [Brevibacillus sp. DP1.3A]UED72188.1 hypothetical protein HP399_015575 [Brevibacillus sp. DP1.3A]
MRTLGYDHLFCPIPGLGQSQGLNERRIITNHHLNDLALVTGWRSDVHLDEDWREVRNSIDEDGTHVIKERYEDAHKQLITFSL